MVAGSRYGKTPMPVRRNRDVTCHLIQPLADMALSHTCQLGVSWKSACKRGGAYANFTQKWAFPGFLGVFPGGSGAFLGVGLKSPGFGNIKVGKYALSTCGFCTVGPRPKGMCTWSFFAVEWTWCPCCFSTLKPCEQTFRCGVHAPKQCGNRNPFHAKKTSVCTYPYSA